MHGSIEIKKRPAPIGAGLAFEQFGITEQLHQYRPP